MALGVILIILIIVLVLAILVAIGGYTAQVIRRYQHLKSQPRSPDKTGDSTPKSPAQ